LRYKWFGKEGRTGRDQRRSDGDLDDGQKGGEIFRGTGNLRKKSYQACAIPTEKRKSPGWKEDQVQKGWSLKGKGGKRCACRFTFGEGKGRRKAYFRLIVASVGRFEVIGDQGTVGGGGVKAKEKGERKQEGTKGGREEGEPERQKG